MIEMTRIAPIDAAAQKMTRRSRERRGADTDPG
jgi:hypothetical protein